MQCAVCGSEILNVHRVTRNRRRLEDLSWTEDLNCDTREVCCSECKAHYVEECKLTFAITYDNDSYKSKLVPIKDYKPLFQAKSRRNQLDLFKRGEQEEAC